MAPKKKPLDPKPMGPSGSKSIHHFDKAIKKVEDVILYNIYNLTNEENLILLQTMNK